MTIRITIENIGRGPTCEILIDDDGNVWSKLSDDQHRYRLHGQNALSIAEAYAAITNAVIRSYEARIQGKTVT